LARRFKRQESWRLKRVKPAWRRPRGGTSRIRLEASGWPRKPNVGFRKSGSIRGLHPSGLMERLVKQERDFEGIDPKKHIIRLGHQIGEKKRLVFLERARQLKVKIANPGTVEPGARQVEEVPGEEESKLESEAGESEQAVVESVSEEESSDKAKSAIENESETPTILKEEESEEEDNE
jgi:large subunit ribosomal protein L32e